MHTPKPRKNGTREHARFPCVLSVAVPQHQANGLEMLAADGLLSVSDHVRLAIQDRLLRAGVLAAPMTASVNGNQEHANVG